MINGFCIAAEMTVRGWGDGHSVEGLGCREYTVDDFPVDIA